MKIEQAIKNIKDIVNIQCANGNWDYDPYMQGMANGLLCALAILEEKEPEYKKAPEKWLADLPKIKTEISISNAVMRLSP
jgi:hypothetical protein